jgi:hypothetical protein
MKAQDAISSSVLVYFGMEAWLTIAVSAKIFVNT